MKCRDCGGELYHYPGCNIGDHGDLVGDTEGASMPDAPGDEMPPVGDGWPKSFDAYDWETLLNDAANALDEYDLSAKEIRQGETTMSADNVRALAKRIGSLLAAEDALAAAREENEVLLRHAVHCEVLLRYAVHCEGCKKTPQTINGVTYGSALPPHDCTCGLDAALDAVNLTEQQ